MANDAKTPVETEHVCTDCNDTFVYTVAEQRFRDEQGMSAPSRCPECRADRRAQRNADLINGTSIARPGEYRDRQRKGKGSAHTPPQDRHPAICADCGQSTMVPFIPRGDRPVYCRSCFNARRGR